MGTHHQSAGESAGETKSSVTRRNAAIKHIEDRFPHNVVLQTDNGSEFSKLFEDSIDERITVTQSLFVIAFNYR